MTIVKIAHIHCASRGLPHSPELSNSRGPRPEEVWVGLRGFESPLVPLLGLVCDACCLRVRGSMGC